MSHTIKRTIVGGLIATATAIAMSAGASGHVLDVETPSGNTKQTWVGGPAVPGQGNGLVPGGPTGEITLPPSHENGLVTACEAIRANGNGVVDIFGPFIPGQETCRHGGQ